MHTRRTNTEDSVSKQPAVTLFHPGAIESIEAHRDGPFFLYLPHTMLHNPLGVSEEFKGHSDWRDYGDAIQKLDHHVGCIFDTLERLDIDDNTKVICASDNGRGPGRTPQQKIRGRKLSTYEGSIRVTAIAWGPGLGIQTGVESSVDCDPAWAAPPRAPRWDAVKRLSLTNEANPHPAKNFHNPELLRWSA